MNEDTAGDVLISRYVNGESTDAEREELRERLARDPAFARLIFRQAFREQELRDFYDAGAFKTGRPVERRRAFRLGRWIPLAAAAAVLVAIGIWRFAGDRGADVRPGPAVARVAEHRGEVKELRADGTWTNAKNGAAVHAGMSMRIGAGSAAKLRYEGEDTWVEAQENTEIECRRSETGGHEIYLRNGCLLAEVAAQPDDRPFRLVTAHGRVTVVGTRLRLAARGAKTRLVMEEGKARVESRSSSAALIVEDGRFVEFSNEGVDRVRPNRDLTFGDGKNLFFDDFEHGLAQWTFSAFAYRKSDTAGVNRIIPLAERPVEGTQFDDVEVVRNGRQTRVMELDSTVGGEGAGVAAFCRWSEPGRSYVIEYAWRADLVPAPVQSRMQNDIPIVGVGGFKVESGDPRDETLMLADLLAQGRDGKRWDRRRIEIVHYRDAEGRPSLVLREFRGRNQGFVGSLVKGPTFAQQLRIGVSGMRIWVDDYTVKELVPEM